MRTCGCSRFRAFVHAAAVTACVLAAGSAHPCAAKVVRVEVSAKPADLQPRTTDAFARLVRRELERLELAPDHDAQDYVLSATLVELTTQADRSRATTTCAVSVALRQEQDGAVRAVLRGRARASDAKSRADLTRAAAMEAAVHSALSRLEQALR
jgi:hypothetical protein